MVLEAPPARSPLLSRAADLPAVFRHTYRSFARHNPSRFGAALSFFFVFTIGPSLLIAISGLARVFGRDAAQQKILSFVASFFGNTAAAAVAEMVKAAATPNAGWLATAIGFSGLLFGVSGVYRQIRDALRTIWHVEPVHPKGLLAKLTHRMTSIATVLPVTLLLAISALADAAIAVTGHFAESHLKGGEVLWHLVQLSVSSVVLSILFALLFRYLPKRHVRWRDVLPGAVVTALLFVLGKFLLGLYLGKAAVGSRYGPAGSVVVVMVWAYWSAQIFFFGLELTHQYSDEHDPAAQAE
ncbi:MAG: YihY/virulence factor BrkB family protein [Thermoanaerobaculia bacterium]